MSATPASAVTSNRRLLLIERPVGPPSIQHFRIDDAPIPAPSAERPIVLRNERLLIEARSRARMNANPGIAEPVALGAVMAGDTLARVVESHDPTHPVGALRLAAGGWQQWHASDGQDLVAIDRAVPEPAWALALYGATGFAAWYGLLRIGRPMPRETVVIPAAAGTVGGIAGQLARQRGCRVVGIAGGPDKCRLAIERYGFDACVDHHEDAALPQRLAEACPRGIDVYLETTGGAPFEAALPLLNPNARVPLCGQSAYLNATTLPGGYDLTPRVMRVLLARRVRLQGYVAADHRSEQAPAFEAELRNLLASGGLHLVEDIIDGLDHAPAALAGLLAGHNLGTVSLRL